MQWRASWKVDEAFREVAFETGVVDASEEHHNKSTAATYLLLNSTFGLLDSSFSL